MRLSSLRMMAGIIWELQTCSASQQALSQLLSCALCPTCQFEPTSAPCWWFIYLYTHTHNRDCGDGFTAVYIYQYVKKLCNLNMRNLPNVNYISLKLFKKSWHDAHHGWVITLLSSVSLGTVSHLAPLRCPHGLGPHHLTSSLPLFSSPAPIILCPC